MARPARPDAHEALLDAARDSFARRGVAGARVEDIARRAGISKGAFYLHFRSKEAAFGELAHRLLGALDDHAGRRREVAERLGRSGADAGAREESERAVAVDLLELLWRGRHVLAAVGGAVRPRDHSVAAEVHRRLRALSAQRIAHRRARGAPRGEEAEVFADVFAGACEALARRMAGLREKPDVRAWSRCLVNVLYAGGGAAPAPARAAAPAHDPWVRGAGGAADAGDAPASPSPSPLDAGPSAPGPTSLARPARRKDPRRAVLAQEGT